MRELGDYRLRSLAAAIAPRGRRVRGHRTQGRSPAYNTIIAVVSIVEEFTIATLAARLDNLFDTTTRVMSAAHRAMLRDIEGQWAERTKATRQWFDLAVIVEYDELLAFVEARNSIAHGLGRLTRRQLADDGGKAILNKLVKVGVTDAGGTLVIDRAAVERCVTAATKVIAWADKDLRSATLRPT
jgi:hypothetical protein